MKTIQADWLRDPAVKAVFRAFAERGHQIYAVGGSVRDALLGISASDVDFATDAEPAQSQALGHANGFGVVPVGAEHGTIRLIVEGRQFEVTSFRSDVETDGRHAVVAFGGDKATDAARRDFTINAVYVDATGNVYDPLGAMDDLGHRRIRFIGDAHQRIREDYLRILRFFRFMATIGDPANGVDPQALAACAEEADGIQNLARERVGQEMRKLLAAPNPAPAMASMAISGILARVLPGADASVLAVLVHLEEQADVAPNWIRRLAVIGGENVKDALRLSRPENRKIGLLLTKLASGQTLPQMAYKDGAEPAVDVMLLRAATLGQPLALNLVATANTAAAQVFPIKASDLRPAYEGERLGKKLSELQDAWIASDFSLGKSDLLS